MKEENNKLIVKNMVCPRCIEAVIEILNKLDIPYLKIDLGNIYLKNELSEDKIALLDTKLKERGFEIVVSIENQIVNEIKSLIVDRIHYNNDELSSLNFTQYLEQKTALKYTKLSKVFSKIENRTIEKYIILQKIEKVKELLNYGESTLSEISYKLDYSSPQHLSKQFKQIVGITPSEFKNKGGRKTLDDV